MQERFIKIQLAPIRYISAVSNLIREVIILKRFESLFHVIWGIDILFGKLTRNIGVEFEKNLLQAMPLWVGISCKVCLLFKNL